MDTLARTITTRELRGNLADTIGTVAYGHDRVGITRNGKLAAVLIDVEDFRTLEHLERLMDVRAYDEAKAADDSGRVSAQTLRAELGL